eukprot:361505-Chlamydomonas_euryale.AAC.10
MARATRARRTRQRTEMAAAATPWTRRATAGTATLVAQSPRKRSRAASTRRRKRRRRPWPLASAAFATRRTCRCGHCAVHTTAELRKNGDGGVWGWPKPSGYSCPRSQHWGCPQVQIHQNDLRQFVMPHPCRQGGSMSENNVNKGWTGESLHEQRLGTVLKWKWKWKWKRLFMSGGQTALQLGRKQIHPTVYSRRPSNTATRYEQEHGRDTAAARHDHEASTPPRPPRGALQAGGMPPDMSPQRLALLLPLPPRPFGAAPTNKWSVWVSRGQPDVCGVLVTSQPELGMPIPFFGVAFRSHTIAPSPPTHTMVPEQSQDLVVPHQSQDPVVPHQSQDLVVPHQSQDLAVSSFTIASPCAASTPQCCACSPAAGRSQSQPAPPPRCRRKQCLCTSLCAACTPQCCA